MSKGNFFNSEIEEKGSDSSSEETETGKNGEKVQTFSDYENQRLKRMAENKARMEAMGLHKMAASLMGSAQKKEKDNKKEKKGKRKVNEEDEDYKPEEEEEEDDDNLGFLSDDDGDNDFEDSTVTKFKKANKKSSTSSKKVTAKNVGSSSDFVDVDDDALMQAIALSLQDCAGFLDVADHGPSRSPHTHAKDCDVDKRREISPIKEDTGRRKKKKSTNSRVQMTEDELILHFFQFDGAGHGGITLQDLRRVAAAHDFTWSDKEMADMVHIFDTDGDGKLSLEDFRKIVGRCNMIQPVMDSKSD